MQRALEQVLELLGVPPGQVQGEPVRAALARQTAVDVQTAPTLLRALPGQGAQSEPASARWAAAVAHWVEREVGLARVARLPLRSAVHTAAREA